MASNWDDYVNSGMQPQELSVALKALPADLANELNSKVIPLISSRKIEAIKALRNMAGLSLMTAKQIVDLLQAGATVAIGRCTNPSVISAIEHMESVCKTTIRDVASDNKTVVVLLNIRDQLSNLWTDLVIGEDADDE